MVERRCRFCGQSLLPSKYQPGQLVCGSPDWQRRRRAEYRRQKIAADPEYSPVCRDSAQKWRSRHPEYWPRYRQQPPAAVERNRQQHMFGSRSGGCAVLPTTTRLRGESGSWKHFRPGNRRLRHVANNNLLVLGRLLPDNRSGAMLTADQINDLHRLYWAERWPTRRTNATCIGAGGPSRSISTRRRKPLPPS